MSKSPEELARITGCSLTEAIVALESTLYWENAVSTVDSMMITRRREYGDKLQEIWSQFADKPKSDELGVSQTMAYLEALNVPLDSPIVLAIAFELQAPSLGVLKHQKFIDGWARLEAQSLEEMRVCISKLQGQMSEKWYFRQVYRNTFLLNLEENQKSLCSELASVYWDVLLAPQFPNIIKKWQSFLQTSPCVVNRDLWNMLLEFCRYCQDSDPALTKYDESSAWPLQIDDFVDYWKATL